MKTIILTVILITFSTLVLAQNWLRSDGGLNNDEALSIDHDGIGNIYTTGYFNSTSNFENTIISSTGLSDIFISKRDANGNAIWTVQAGGTQADRVFSSKTDFQGNTVITGYFTSNAQFGSNIDLDANAASQDAFVAKVDTDGNFLWAIPIGGQLDDIGYGIDIDANGNIIVTGQFSGIGTFGPYTLESTIDPFTDTPSLDVYILKLNTYGDVLWVKQGIANATDQGIDISTDSEGNIYAIGLFNDNITFDSLHENDDEDAGYIAKFDPDGNELWFLKLVSLYLHCKDIEVDQNDDIVLLGDYQGQMTLFYSPLQYLNNSHNNDFFIAKFNSSGDLIWISQDGSDNSLSAKAFDIAPNNDIIITGSFSCVMDEYSEEYGSGLFNSVGFGDAFISKYSASGNWQWARNFGGSKDEQSNAISIFMNDLPIIAGGFMGYFNVPSNNSFEFNDEENDQISWFGENVNISFCNDSDYGKFLSVETEGSRDIFIGSPYAPEKGPYDYYNRTQETDCTFGIVPPCINDCTNSDTACTQLDLEVVRNSGWENFIGPDYIYQWSVPCTNDDTIAWESDLYWVDVTRADGCNSWHLEQDVTIYNIPIPELNSNLGPPFINSMGVNIFDVCYPDSIDIWCTNSEETDNSFWNYQGNELFMDTLTVSQYNLLYHTLSNDFGCSEIETIIVNVHEPIDSSSIDIDPALMFHNDSLGYYINDSITVCASNYFFMYLLDSLTSSFAYSNASITWEIEEGLDYDFPNTLSVLITPDTSGWYTIEASLWLSQGGGCGSAFMHSITSVDIYIEVVDAYQNDPEIIGDHYYCPGDTTLLTAIGGDNYIWYGSPILEQLSPDSVLVNNIGSYYVESTVTSPSGCSSTEVNYFSLNENPIPQLGSNPSPSLLCPEDSVLLYPIEGWQSWLWIDPNGLILSEDSMIYVNEPGEYHCTITDNEGCTMESEYIFIIPYQSPYLLTIPDSVICDYEQGVELNLQASIGSDIEWLSPLSGSPTSQFVYEAGTYSVEVSGCGISDTLSTFIIASNTPSIITSESDEIVCPGEEVILYANEGMQDYLWMPGNIPGDSIIVNQSGEYTLITTDSLGCNGVSEPFVANYYNILTPVSDDVIVCLNDSVELYAEGTEEILWYSDIELTNLVNTGGTFTISIVEEEAIFYIVQQDTMCVSEPQQVSLDLDMASLPIEGFSNGPVCPNDTLILSVNEAVEGINYQWTNQNGLQYFGSNIQISNASDEEAGAWTVYQFNEQCASPNDTVQVEIIPTDPVVLSTEDISICYGDSIEISTLNEFENYTWSPNFQESQYITVYETDDYWVQVTDTNSCIIVSDTIQVTVNELLDSPQIENISICYGDNVSLNVLPNYGVNWFDVDNNLISNDDSWLTEPITEENTFYVQYFDELNCMSAIEPVVVSLQIEGDIAQILGEQEYCEGEELYLFSSLSGPSYTWYTPNGVSNSEAILIDNIDIEGGGEYSLVISSPDCEVIAEPVFVDVWPIPIVELSQAGDCLLGVYYFELLSGYAQYFWNDSLGTNSFELIAPDFLEVLVISDEGCSTSDEIFVSESSCPDQMPNVFTPNNDQWNDVIDFSLFYANVESINIFNRWGNEVRTLSGSKLVWEGKMNNGNHAIEGVYYYTVNENSLGNGSINNSGVIQLLR